jgi:hypothetical protein
VRVADSGQNMLATARQKSKIAQLCLALGLQERLEDTVNTSREASDLIKELCVCIKVNREDRHHINGGRPVYRHGGSTMVVTLGSATGIFTANDSKKGGEVVLYG